MEGGAPPAAQTPAIAFEMQEVGAASSPNAAPTDAAPPPLNV
jgi:hypothetical protein